MSTLADDSSWETAYAHLESYWRTPELLSLRFPSKAFLLVSAREAGPLDDAISGRIAAAVPRARSADHASGPRPTPRSEAAPA